MRPEEASETPIAEEANFLEKRQTAPTAEAGFKTAGLKGIHSS
jgi:hypothetical protein